MNVARESSTTAREALVQRALHLLSPSELSMESFAAPGTSMSINELSSDVILPVRHFIKYWGRCRIESDAAVTVCP